MRVHDTLAELVVDVSALKPYGRNPRVGDVEAIARSLESNGQYRPVVVNRRTNEILAGNHTFRAAQQLGWVEIAATFVDVDEATAQRIVLADNRTADLGGYDDVRLAVLLEEVAAQGQRELEATGYDQAYLEDLLAALEALEFHTDPDHVPTLPDSTVSTPGTLWLLGRHRLLCGDATSTDDVARLMDGKRARLMATDPPYLVDYDGSNHPQSTVNSAMTRNKQWDEYVDPATGQALYEAFIAVAYEHALAEDAPVYQWHADMRRSLLVAAWESHGLLAHQTIIWVKSRAVLTRSDFMWQHEPCLFGWRKGSRPPTERRAPANETTVWQVDQQGSSNDIHPTEKPVELFARPLRWHLRAGEIAFEPFAGSGTQIIAAEMEQRTCYALELAPQYVDVAARRWQEFTRHVPINAGTGVPYDFTRRADG